MPSFRGVGGGRDRFPFRNLLTSLPERLARNLCGGCPWRLAAGWRSGETRRADSLPLCAAQGLSESPPAHAVGTSLLNFLSGTRRPKLFREAGAVVGLPESDKSGSWTREVGQEHGCGEKVSRVNWRLIS